MNKRTYQLLLIVCLVTVLSLSLAWPPAQAGESLAGSPAQTYGGTATPITRLPSQADATHTTSPRWKRERQRSEYIAVR